MWFPASAMQEQADDHVVELSPASGNETILLVDDEEPIRDLGTRMLTRAGYQVITAAEGPEALDIYRGKQDEISLILLDVIMPVMSGVQCLEKLVEINPRVKVLVTSGFAIDGSARRVVEQSSKGFVSKPFQIAEVLTVIREILDETGS
jgi:CheY-like chemotaxis protein